MDSCGIRGQIRKIAPVSGGLMHRMYRVETDGGKYAVKHLNPIIMKRPDALANYAKAEKLEETLAARKAELEKLKKEQGDVIEASIARRKELSKLTLQKADLEAATAELRAIFEEEIKNARNSK